MKVTIEERIVSHLSKELDCRVATEVPKDYVDGSLVVIEKTGSSKLNLITSATIAIQSYGDSMFESASLNEDVKDAMEGMIEYSDIASCKLQSDYNYTDTRLKKNRYQAVFSITYYEKEK